MALNRKFNNISHPGNFWLLCQVLKTSSQLNTMQVKESSRIFTKSFTHKIGFACLVHVILSDEFTLFFGRGNIRNTSSFVGKN